ncbi:MAG: hypothetical protein M3Q36_03240 [bacterium]|nr:hypothetical protein [bacterium]
MAAEKNPFTPFESEDKSEKSGEKKAAKKKKTTRLPKAVIPSPPQESAPENTNESTLKSLFEKNTVDDAVVPSKKYSKKSKIRKAEAQLSVTEPEVSNTEAPQSILPPLESASSENIIDQTEQKPKRMRGRPRKQALSIETPVETKVEKPETTAKEGELEVEEPVKIEHVESTVEPAHEPAQEVSFEKLIADAEVIPIPASTENTDESPAAEFEAPIQTPAIEETPDVRYYESIPTEPIQERRRIIDSDDYGVETRSTPVANNSISRSELSSAVYRAEKRGLSRGVVSGGIVGWWIGRRGKNEAVSRVENSMDKQNSIIKQLRQEQAATVERLNRAKTAPEQAPPPFLPPIPVETLAAAKTEATPMLQFAEAPIITENAVYQFEKPASAEPLAKTEATDKIKELPPEDKPIVESIYHAPVGTHIETSAWHRMEIDNKTGHTVEIPSVEYGEEFKQEQKQERLQRDIPEPVVAAQVGTTIVNNNSDSIVDKKSQTDTADKLKSQAKSIAEALSDTDYVKKELAQRATQPSTWLMSIGVVILLFLLGVLR